MRKNKIQSNPLEENIRMLFRKCGFIVSDKEEIVILDGGKKHRTVEISVMISDDDRLKILVECKGGKQNNLKIPSLVHDYEELKKKASADKVIFVVPDRDIVVEDKEYIEGKGMVLWDRKQLDYYEALGDAIGEYAKYEIIYSLGLKTKEQSEVHNATAIKIIQPFFISNNSTYEIFLFSITPQNLLKTGIVLRRASQINKKAFQRLLKKSRLSDIGKYVSKSNASLPTDIVVALPEKVEVRELNLPDGDIHLSDRNTIKLVRLSIPLEYASLEIIDGQHRLFGFVHADQKTREKFNLVITGLRNLDEEQKKQLFIDINEKAKKLDPNLLAHLSYTDDEIKCQNDSKLMAIKIVMKLNEIPPFKNRIRYLETGDEIITLKGFSAYDLRSLISDQGSLRRFTRNNSSSKYIEVISGYFSVVSSIFKKEWQDPTKYIISTNRGITAFLKLFKPLLNSIKFKMPADFNDFKKTKTQFMGECKGYLKSLKGFNFETAHLKGQYMGGAGWKKFYEDLEKCIKRDHPKFG